MEIIARSSQGPTCKSDKKAFHKHIIDGLVRKAKHQGIVAVDYQKLINDHQNTNMMRAADWVAQVCPGTDGEGGACLIYGHS